MTGDIELIGRLFGLMRLAIGLPAMLDKNEKSVSWLFKIIPPDKYLLPNTVSTELV